MIDVVGYLETTDIDLVYSGENVGANDIAMECPWCDDPSTHMTIHRATGVLNCWRCNFDEYKAMNKKGWGPSFKALIKEIEQCSWTRAKEIYEEIGGETSDYLKDSGVKPAEKCVFPYGVVPFSAPGQFTSLRDRIYTYLINRNFSKYHIEKYKLCFGTMGEWSGRLFIPYFKDNEMVNWVSRRTNPLAKTRYKNCKLTECKVTLRELLYGEDSFIGNRLRLVEGAFDKIRIGSSALALSRSSFSSSQRDIIVRLSRQCNYISIMLDPEAEKRALSIAETLSVSGKQIKIIALPVGQDPASLDVDSLLYYENNTPFYSY